MPDIEVLYEKLSEKLYSYILKLSGSEHIAEEILQETFYRAFEYIIINKNELKEAWFFVVAKNLFFDYVNKTKKQVTTENIEIMDSNRNNLPDEKLYMHEKSKEVNEVLRKLNENYRKLLILRDYKQFSYKEISKILNISMNQVKVGIYRARNVFKKIYERRNL